MYATRIIHLLLVALGFVAAAQGTFLDIQNAIEAALRPRQAENSSPSAAASAVATPTPSASQPNVVTTPTASAPSTPEETPTAPVASPTTTPTTSTRQQAQPTSTPQSQPSTPAETSANAQPSQPAASSASSASNGNTAAPTTSQSEEPRTTAEPTTFTSLVVITTTGSQGEEIQVTSAATIVSTPTLSADNDGNGDGGGLSDGTKRTIIGVTCGVGGAIVLGALGFVAWRIWGRKKRAEENDGLMDYQTAGTSAFNSEPKPDALSNPSNASTGRSPFQTTLEDYHRPGQVNPSSNF